MIEAFLNSLPMAVRLPLSIGLLVGGLVALYFGSEYLVRGAIRLATRLGVGAFTIGVTVVAFGTSAPELFASISAVYSGSAPLAVGNVVGSNIANVCLILGVAALVRPVPVAKEVFWGEFMLVILATMLGIWAMTSRFSPPSGSVVRWEGALLFAGLLGYVCWQYFSGRQRYDEDEAARELEQEHKVSFSERPPLVRQLILIGVGLLLLTLGAQMFVDGGVQIALIMGVPEEVVGLTVLAFGTSVPELAAAIRATMAKEAAIVVGNIVGSNVFNLLCVLGLTTLVAPGPIAVPAMTVVRDNPMMLFVIILCMVLMRPRFALGRAGGAVLVTVYIGYIIWVYMMSGVSTGGGG
jgi:cation:H+ antiporter